ncbi:MAG TPA: hypothetical protein VHC69_21935 [Polyangiaceae bacterium]|nr:hypothetical protein [Polyangiaceae bacterium]
MRWLLFGVLSITGCVNPDADLQAFQRRLTQHAAADAGDGAVDGGVCSIRPDEITGPYLLAISASIAPGTPILALLDVSTPATQDGAALAFVAQPLAASDRRTKVGEPLSLGPFPIDGDGAFHADITGLSVSGDANPVTPGAPIEADLELTGNLCAKTRLYCGNVSGQIIRPLKLSLDGSTFTLTPIPPGSSLPEQPTIDCRGTLADPL